MEDPAKTPSANDRVLLAYAEVFGTLKSRRTNAQRAVILDMERRGYIRRPTLIPDGQGHVCSLRMAQAEGCRVFHLDTQLILEKASKLTGDTPARVRGRIIVPT